MSTGAGLAAFALQLHIQLTALVDPPSAMTTVIAFSNAARVMMSRGLMSAFSSSSTALHTMPRHNTFSCKLPEYICDVMMHALKHAALTGMPST